MTLPPDLNVYISALVFVLGAYIIALYVGLIVWTFRDIRSRSRDLLAQILATFLVALFTLPGLLIYLLLRPHETLAEEYERELAEAAVIQELEARRICPNCKHAVEPDFIVCPYCHQQLRLRCVGCGRLLDPEWDVCPYCGRFLEREEESPPEEPDEEALVPAMASVGEALTLSEAEASVGAGAEGEGDAISDEFIRDAEEPPRQKGDDTSQEDQDADLPELI